MTEEAPGGGAPPPRADGAPWRNFHGRRHGKRLRDGQKRRLAEDLGPLTVPGVGWEENPDRAAIDPAALFPTPVSDVWLEIGFGGGEHMVATAAQAPEVGLIGCEPFINGVAMLLAQIEDAGVCNVRVHPGDARHMLDVLPDASIGRAYLLYPDPWPKTRHHKRRFMAAENLDPLARVMRPGAELRVATDIDDYSRQALAVVHDHPEFAWTARTADDWRRPWAGWPSTRYERKALREGRTPSYLRFVRR